MWAANMNCFLVRILVLLISSLAFFEPQTVTLPSGAIYGAFLLSEVGKSVKISLSNSRPVVKALVALHEKGIIHGDPRVYNIVRIGETLKWIDFREYRSDDAATASLMAKDMQTCIKSFFKKDSHRVRTL